MAAAGIWLESPSDMASAFPWLWEDEQAAKDWKRGEQSGVSLNRESYKGKLHRVRYQRAGPKQRWKEAWYDPGVLSDPRDWLEARVGPLAGYAVEEVVEEAPAEAQTVERREIDLVTPTGRTVTIEHLVVGAEVVTGRVAVSHLIRPRLISPDARIAA
jgi:hypothetical protein